MSPEPGQVGGVNPDRHKNPEGKGSIPITQMSLCNLLTETKPEAKQGGTPASANSLSFVGQAGHFTGAALPQCTVTWTGRRELVQI